MVARATRRRHENRNATVRRDGKILTIIKTRVRKSFARIHRRNLIAQGLIPIPIDDAIYKAINFGDTIELPNIAAELNKLPAMITLKVNGKAYTLDLKINDFERRQMICGGALRLAKLDVEEEKKAKNKK